MVSWSRRISFLKEHWRSSTTWATRSWQDKLETKFHHWPKINLVNDQRHSVFYILHSLFLIKGRVGFITLFCEDIHLTSPLSLQESPIKAFWLLISFLEQEISLIFSLSWLRLATCFSEPTRLSSSVFLPCFWRRRLVYMLSKLFFLLITFSVLMALLDSMSTCSTCYSSAAICLSLSNNCCKAEVS